MIVLEFIGYLIGGVLLLLALGFGGLGLGVVLTSCCRWVGRKWEEEEGGD